MPTYGSPWLIAVSRVLLRLPVPRHSPCALCSLTMCFSWFFFINIAVNSLRQCCFEIVDFTMKSDLSTASSSLYLLLPLFSFQGTDTVCFARRESLAKFTLERFFCVLPFGSISRLSRHTCLPFCFRFQGGPCVKAQPCGGLRWTQVTLCLSGLYSVYALSFFCFPYPTPCGVWWA